jgi:hypothetical protein
MWYNLSMKENMKRISVTEYWREKNHGNKSNATKEQLVAFAHGVLKIYLDKT